MTMGSQPSKPQPGAELQVIGAGLPRTGTASLSAALSILLDGPVYHGGTQLLVGTDEHDVKTWCNIFSRTPYKNTDDRRSAMESMMSMLGGFVAAADTPIGQFVEELIELYPDAKVICTVRDPDAWAKSMDDTANTSLQTALEFILFWVPVMRYFPRYGRALQNGRFAELYFDPGQKVPNGRTTWARHMVYLERTVPKEKLMFFDVRDGWEPLCGAVGVPVPEGIDFPKINDGKAIEIFAKKQIQRGLVRWGIVIGACATVGLAGWSVLGYRRSCEGLVSGFKMSRGL